MDTYATKVVYLLPQRFPRVRVLHPGVGVTARSVPKTPPAPSGVKKGQWKSAAELAPRNDCIDGHAKEGTGQKRPGA